ncbi:ATP-binding protein [Micrococcaceae sp. AOP34-BR2-30]|uniref:ATP-binding protein n=1 Tax=Citricoccus muralis TaxID=169134 RepID=A0ABY8H418_9MICC|nr:MULTISPECIES: ATP-binding protein [Citricoccus]WBL18238.1 ATP-binding protein [Citricoccus sp. NR2]WBL19059.1 ATP-binding protein [Citricoccus sp. NR2]WBL20112.1 ATP-binding protein [Citricoccus sp. NR2]WFP15374.1 ATP-binding protein [Citricoccus muralis]WFP15825.1 ATP-binding protein [Citricoccus muralis]
MTTTPASPALMNSVFTTEDKEKFRTLRITHLAAKFEELIIDESNDHLTPEQIFLAAVDDALDQRRVKNIQKLLLAAQLPIMRASIAEIHYQEGRNITPARMARYAAHDWANETANLLITSPTGGGKTYIACAIAVAACHNEHKVFYTRMDELARRLVIARGDGIAHQALLNRLSDADLLIIDDFLTVGIDPEAANDLFAILANREHRAATMIASQTGPAYWASALPDRIAADSIVNRLANNARTINLGDIDMRRHQGEQTRAAPGYWE